MPRPLRIRLIPLLLLAASGGLVFEAIWSRRGLRDLLVLRQQELQLRQTCDQLERENSVLNVEVEKLRSDDVYLQSLIHKELGYVKPNELVYRFSPRSSDELPSE